MVSLCVFFKNDSRAESFDRDSSFCVSSPGGCVLILKTDRDFNVFTKLRTATTTTGPIHKRKTLTTKKSSPHKRTSWRRCRKTQEKSSSILNQLFFSPNYSSIWIKIKPIYHYPIVFYFLFKLLKKNIWKILFNWSVK